MRLVTEITSSTALLTNFRLDFGGRPAWYWTD